MVETPHGGSLAALVLLCRKLAGLELDQWLRFRDEFLKDSMTDGKLVCAYCGRNDLIPDVPAGARQPANLATVDHVIPVSKGGAKFDRDNLVVACYSCNQRKADNELQGQVRHRLGCQCGCD